MTDAVADKAEFEGSAVSLNYQSWLPRGNGEHDSSPLLGDRGHGQSSARYPEVRAGTQKAGAKSAGTIYKELLDSSTSSQQPFVKNTPFGHVRGFNTSYSLASGRGPAGMWLIFNPQSINNMSNKGFKYK